MVTRRFIANHHARTRVFTLALYFLLSYKLDGGWVYLVAGISLMVLFYVSGED